MDKTRKVSFATLLITIGIIYGDIGTSPLYTFKAIVGARAIDEVLVFGGVSCVFWTLVLQTTVKYVWLTLRADNEGEGGIFALYSLVRKNGKKLAIFTMIGAAALLADGIITPAVSVTAAIEGLSMMKGMEELSVVPIVVVIISIVFFVQRFGTERVGKAFGPVMAVWFGVLFVVGITQIVHYPSVLKALNPYYAIELLTQYPQGFWLLGAVFLCTTGAEALYSDMGHCGRRNIRITWFFVNICLVVNYLGQAAWLLHNGNAALGSRNPFFEAMPQWFLLPGILIATAAAVIASQALISGSFSLINEAINLNFWQRVAIKQPTETKGQIYIPSINTILWLGCITVVLYFQDSSSMEAAYGLTITLAMLMTTVLLYFFLRRNLHWHRITTFALLFIFTGIELSFLVANIAKFKDGGFITVLVGGAFFWVMYVAYYGRIMVNRYINFIDLRKYYDKIVDLSNDKSIPKYTTHLVYLTKANNREEIEEKIITSIFAQNPKRADVYWFFHINRVNNPYALNYQVEELVEDKVIKINVDVGFRVRPRAELYFKRIINDLIANKELNLHLRYNGSTKYNPELGFKFIIISRYLSYENEFHFREGAILKSYFLLRKLSLSGQSAFGIDESNVVIERRPLVHQPVQDLRLARKIF
ncbi:MAG: KUP/HAK/KT family potassium transporter [Prevotellaceae bacterium]|jgi:KUP system potassium uptake protein|nr:KUP/HAK/KT family potassium transporter [Prevotellaceae bacterium]